MSDYESGDTMVEAFRRANPVPADQAVSRRSLPSAHALFADVIAQRPRRVRRRVLVIAIAIALVALMLMAVTALRRVGSSLSIAPVCYGSDSLHGPKVVAGGGDPAEACAPYWANGRFGEAKVPDFDVCVLQSGVLAVFPGESGSVCSRLDLPESTGDNRVERFISAVNRRVSASCLGLDDAQRIIKSELLQRRISGWTVTPGASFDTEQLCASIAADPSARRISIVAIANPVPATPAEP